jgi:ABC-type nickel/cobalt efflux system permease component RcnA
MVERLDPAPLSALRSTRSTASPVHEFRLVSRARGWSRGKTLAVSAFAGLGHVLLTSLLGLVIAWFGFKIDERMGRYFPWIAGGLLVAIGLFYLWRQFTGRGVGHHHVLGSHHHPTEQCGHEHEHEHSHWEDELKESALISKKKGDWAAISGLFLMLTLSPCEGFLPVYLSGVQFGWHGFVVLSAILAFGTLAGMMLFTWLTLLGMEHLPLQKFERYEAAMLGGMFCLLGGLLIVLETLGLA